MTRRIPRAHWLCWGLVVALFASPSLAQEKATSPAPPADASDVARPAVASPADASPADAEEELRVGVMPFKIKGRATSRRRARAKELQVALVERLRAVKRIVVDLREPDESYFSGSASRRRRTLSKRTKANNIERVVIATFEVKRKREKVSIVILEGGRSIFNGTVTDPPGELTLEDALRDALVGFFPEEPPPPPPPPPPPEEPTPPPQAEPPKLGVNGAVITSAVAGGVALAALSAGVALGVSASVATEDALQLARGSPERLDQEAVAYGFAVAADTLYLTAVLATAVAVGAIFFIPTEPEPEPEEAIEKK